MHALSCCCSSAGGGLASWMAMVPIGGGATQACRPGEPNHRLRTHSMPLLWARLAVGSDCNCPTLPHWAAGTALVGTAQDVYRQGSL